MRRAELEQIARSAAREYGIPVGGYLAQIRVESAWQPLAVSPVGAMGLAQITPAAMADTGITGDPFDPVVNLRVGAAYMVWCRDWLAGQGLPSSWPYVLGAYNAGIGTVRSAVRSHGPRWLDAMPRETQSYVRRLAPAYGSAANGAAGSLVPVAVLLLGLVGLAALAAA